MKNFYRKLTCSSFITLLTILTPEALADVKSMRTDSIQGILNGVETEVGATFTALSTNESPVNDEYFTSFDFAASLPMAHGEWLVYIEGNTTPKDNGVNEIIVGVNGDVGSALDDNGNGRLQLSEIHYTWQQFSGSITAGLVDLSAFVDTSDIANDENSQFLSSNFTNNPTIAFPDYTLGVGYQFSPENEKWGLTALLGGSHGIADNEDKSYLQLVKLGDEGKGAFSAIEGFYLLNETILKLGIWYNSADFELLSNHEETEANYGLYAVAEDVADIIKWNVRFGIANDDVSEIKQFASVAVELPLLKNTLGIALGKSWVSDHLSSNPIGSTSEIQHEDSQQAELYYRIALSENVQVTPSIQYLENSGFNAELNNVWVYGVRLAWTM